MRLGSGLDGQQQGRGEDPRRPLERAPMSMSLTERFCDGKAIMAHCEPTRNNPGARIKRRENKATLTYLSSAELTWTA
jgi:hypothetical protein